MGINIVLCTFADVTLSHPYPAKDDRFDSVRRAGDTWFSEWLGRDGHALYRSVGEGMDTREFEVYVRPRDLEQARAWVRNTLVDVNYQRWLDLFDLLEADTQQHLWLQEIY
jgi:hypothetical protein